MSLNSTSTSPFQFPGTPFAAKKTLKRKAETLVVKPEPEKKGKNSKVHPGHCLCRECIKPHKANPPIKHKAEKKRKATKGKFLDLTKPEAQPESTPLEEAEENLYEFKRKFQENASMPLQEAWAMFLSFSHPTPEFTCPIIFTQEVNEWLEYSADYDNESDE
jgi:hypothetical protein